MKAITDAGLQVAGRSSSRSPRAPADGQPQAGKVWKQRPRGGTRTDAENATVTVWVNPALDGRVRDTLGSPSTNQRHGCSAPLRSSPMRRELPGCRGRRGAVVGDQHAAVAGDQVGAVVGAGRARGPGTAWPGPLHRSRSRRAAGPRRRASRSSPSTGASGPEQHGEPVALVAAHRVGAPVHAVGEVHVEMARRAEHGRVAAGLPR